MKSKTLLMILLVGMQLPVAMASDDLEPKKVDNLSHAYTDPSYLVGVFEWLTPDQRPKDWHLLKSGQSIKDFAGGPDPGKGWRTFKLVQSIKGDFDNLIFLKEFPIFGEEHSFLPVPGSKWVLILRSVLDDKGDLQQPCKYTVADLKQMPYLNKRNLFELMDRNNGSFCLKWPENFRKPEFVKEYSPQLVVDLQVVASMLLDAERPEVVKANGANDAEATLTVPTAKAVLQRSRKLQPAKPK